MPNIFYANCSNLSQEMINELFITALPKRKKMYQTSFSLKRIVPSLLGDYLVRKIISNVNNIPFNQIDFEYTKYGKPLIKDVPNLHFNVSHSGCWVVVAFSNYRIGIDIEKVREVNLNIADKFFSNFEKALIIKEKHNKRHTFFKIWTLKESYIKAIGSGLSKPLDSFSVISNDGNLRFIKEYDEEFRLETFLVESDYYVSVCFNRQDHSVSINKLEGIKLTANK